jgi:hypothetical protein
MIQNYSKTRITPLKHFFTVALLSNSSKLKQCQIYQNQLMFISVLIENKTNLKKSFHENIYYLIVTIKLRHLLLFI